MRDSSSRLGPIMEGSPRLAAMQASKSLPSSSRTWFSTGINKAGFFVVILFAMLLLRFFKQPPLNNVFDPPHCIHVFSFLEVLYIHG